MTSLDLKDRMQTLRAVVSVNGIEIPYNSITQEVQYHPAPSPEKAWAAASRALVVRQVLLDEAARHGIKATPVVDADGLRETDEEALVRQLLAREIQTPHPDKDACRRFYEVNKHRFCSSPLYEVSHILLAALLDDTDAYEACRARAEDLCTHLRGKPDDFEDLAKRVSDCPSASLDGNLGQLSRGQTTPEFEQALETMSPGELSPAPVASRYGFHIIKLLRRIEGVQLPFEAVETEVSSYLNDRVQRTATAQYIARLVSAANVTGVDLPHARDMRVF